MDFGDILLVFMLALLGVMVIFLGLTLIDACIPNQWSQEIIIYNHTDSDNDDFIIATIDGKWKRIYLLGADDMEFEYGDPICVLVEKWNIIPDKDYTVVNTCE